MHPGLRAEGLGQFLGGIGKAFGSARGLADQFRPRTAW